MFSHNNVLITAMNTVLFLCYISIYCLFLLMVGYLYLCMTNKRGFLRFPSNQKSPTFLEYAPDMTIFLFKIRYLNVFTPKVKVG